MISAKSLSLAIAVLSAVCLSALPQSASAAAMCSTTVTELTILSDGTVLVFGDNIHGNQGASSGAAICDIRGTTAVPATVCGGWYKALQAAMLSGRSVTLYSNASAVTRCTGTTGLWSSSPTNVTYYVKQR